MLEDSVLFISSSWVQLTAVCEAFLALLMPLSCAAQYVPLLPDQLVTNPLRRAPANARSRGLTHA